MRECSDPSRETIRTICGSIQRDWDARTAAQRRLWAATKQQALARKINVGHETVEDSESTVHFMAV